MNKDEKNQLIDSLAEELSASDVFYITDISDLNAKGASDLRRICFKKEVRLRVVKNTLLKRAMEKSNKGLDQLYPVLNGPTSIMFAGSGNVPARLIREFRKTSSRPVLKGAYIQEMIFLGDDQLNILENLKTREELIADIVALLQSPARNVIMALQSGGQKLSGIMKTLSEKPE
ncbi:MAG: 50S ribosomal protein L10 [Bacteroidales bacterium]|nr:50S ribosomal protein L10 [Bacteroidales bacterium]